MQRDVEGQMRRLVSAVVAVIVLVNNHGGTRQTAEHPRPADRRVSTANCKSAYSASRANVRRARRKGEARALCDLQLPEIHVAVDNLLDDAVGELDGQFVGIDCRHGAVAEHRV